MTFSALVLAGTRPGGDPLAGAEGKPHKALIEIGGIPLLERVVTALKNAGAERIGVSCDHPAVISFAKRLGVEIMPTGKGPSESAALAFVAIGSPMVVTTADHALLAAAWVRHLIEQTPADADVGIMLARRDKIEQRLPESRRTYLKFADGSWSGCNLFLLQKPDARNAMDSWQAVEADRKRPWRIVGRLGLATLMSYATGRLTMKDGIERLGRRMGINAALVEAPDGLAAVDVDKLEDLNDIRRLIEEGAFPS